MSVTINLSPDTERKLHERAAQTGQTVEGLIHQLIEREVMGGNGGTQATSPPSGRTFDEILATVRQGFGQSGVTEEELTALFEEAREEVWQEHQRREGTP